MVFVIVETIALKINNYWDPIPFLGLQALSLFVAFWFWTVVAWRFHDAGHKAWLSGIAIVLFAASKTYLCTGWLHEKYFGPYRLSHSEFEMGAAIWTAYIEPQVHVGLIVVALFFLFQPSQPGPNRYGPNPLEVNP